MLKLFMQSHDLWNHRRHNLISCKCTEVSFTINELLCLATMLEDHRLVWTYPYNVWQTTLK